MVKYLSINLLGGLILKTFVGNSYAEKLFYYSFANNDCLNIEAVFSDETSNFICPVNIDINEPFEIKIRSARNNIDKVFLCNDNKKFPMTIINFDSMFDFYSIKIDGCTKKFDYYFEIQKNDRIYFYNKRGLYDVLNPSYNFSIIPGFFTPDWIKGSVMYQIYVDRFFNGDGKNDVVNNEYIYLNKAAKKIEKWTMPVLENDVCNFYGGDLKGVIDKMNYLKDLGIEVIYFNPIFVSPSNHKYDIQDYDYIDPHYGKIVNDSGEPLYFENFNNKFATKYMQRTTDKKNLEASNQLFIQLVETAHANGIKIILDGVFNHCGAFNKWMDKEGFYYRMGYPQGAYRSKNSIYHNYFRWFDENWPNNDCYESWWGFDNHPKLNYEGSRELFDYILNIGKKWVSAPFNADGWRVDVAADIGMSQEFNHKFWREFRLAVKNANPNAVIIAEHYGNPKKWLEGDQWDSVMNYDAFMEPITWFLTGMEKHSEEFKSDRLCNAIYFENAMRYSMAQFSFQSLYCAMNELSNHDHSRFLTRTNMTVGRLNTMGTEAAQKNVNKNVMMEAVVFQMTWPGCPTIYYADEVGLAGWSDPDNRRPFPWDNQDENLLSLHKTLIQIHKKSEALKYGSLEYLHLDYGIISFGRWIGDEKYVVAINNNDVAKEIDIPVWKIGVIDDVLKKVIATAANKFSCNEENYKVSNGFLKINMDSKSAVVLKKMC